MAFSIADPLQHRFCILVETVADPSWPPSAVEAAGDTHSSPGNSSGGRIHYKRFSEESALLPVGLPVGLTASPPHNWQRLFHCPFYSGYPDFFPLFADEDSRLPFQSFAVSVPVVVNGLPNGRSNSCG